MERNEEVQRRYADALDQLIEKVKQDPYILAAILVGYRYAAIYRLPLVASSLSGIEANFNTNLAQLGFISAGGAAWVFFTNLRALLYFDVHSPPREKKCPPTLPPKGLGPLSTRPAAQR